MRFSKVSMAVAALLATSSAWALDPTTTQNLPAGNVVYVSGSTAIDGILQGFMQLDNSDARGPCTVGTIDVYKSATGYLISCTGRTGTALAGINFAIAKSTAGGSATGIFAVARADGDSTTNVGGYPNRATLAANVGAAVPTAASAPISAFNTYTVSSPEVTAKPNAGVSDEDPTTFIGTGGVSATDAATLKNPGTTINGLQQPFGYIVSLPLYRRLQTAEGLATNDDLANVPSLSRAQLRAIFQGNLLDWSTIVVRNRTTGVASAVGTINDFMHVARRGDTSGTQLANNIFLFSSGCAKGDGVAAVSPPDDPATTPAGEVWQNTSTYHDKFFFAGSGTGDVKKFVSDQVLAGGDASNYKIGLIGTDNKSTDVTTAASPDVWRYVAIDGQVGTLWNIMQGNYDALFENTLQSTPNSLRRPDGATGNRQTIWNYVAQNIGNRALLSGANAKFRSSWDLSGSAGAAGDSGVITLGKLPTDADAPTFPLNSPTWPAAIRTFNVARQGAVSTVTRSPVPGVVNNCNNLVQVNPGS